MNTFQLSSSLSRQCFTELSTTLFYKPFLPACTIFSWFPSYLCHFSLLFFSSGSYPSTWSLNVSVLQVLVFGCILYKLSPNKLIQAYIFNYHVYTTYLLIYISLAMEKLGRVCPEPSPRFSYQVTHTFHGKERVRVGRQAGILLWQKPSQGNMKTREWSFH